MEKVAGSGRTTVHSKWMLLMCDRLRACCMFILVLGLMAWLPTPGAASQPDLEERQQAGEQAQPFDYQPQSDACSSLFLDGEGGAQNVPVTLSDMVVVPEGTQSITVRVVLFSREWPTYTGSQSQFDDIIGWNVSLDGQTLSSGELTVNSLHAFFAPGPLPGGNFQIYSENIDTSEITANSAANLDRFGRAINIGDNLLGSGVLIESCLGDIEEGEAEISGTITDIDTGEPIEGATVSLDTGESVVTNAQGRYVFEEVLPGTRLVSAEAENYLKASQSVGLSDGDERIVDLALSPLGKLIIRIEGDHFSPQNRAFFMTGVDHEETFSVFVDWGDVPAGIVELETPVGSFSTTTTDQSVYQAIVNVGGLSVGDTVVAQAILQGGPADSATANLEIVPQLVTTHFPDVAGLLTWQAGSQGGKVEYSTNVPQRVLLSGTVPEAIISDALPLFKLPWGVEVSLPGPLTVKSDGTARMQVIELATSPESGILGAFKIGDFSAKPKGSFKLDWGWDGSAWLTGGAVSLGYGIKWKTEQNSIFITPTFVPIPIPYFYGLELSGNVGVSLGIKPTPAEPIEWNPGGGGTGGAGGALFGGVGHTKIAGIKVSGGAEFDVDLLAAGDGVNFFNDLGILAFAALELFVENLVEFELLRLEGCIWRLQGCPAGDELSDAFETVMRVARQTQSNFVNTPIDLGLLPGYHSGLLVDADAMVVANPVLVETQNGDRMLLRLVEGENRAVFDQGQLVFSLFENNGWSSPEVVRVNGTADREPVSLALGDDRVLIALRDATQNILGEPGADPDIALEALEILWAQNEISLIEFDVSTGSVIQEWSLGTIGQFDGDIRLASGFNGDGPLVAWMQSSGGSPVPSDEQPAGILVSRLGVDGPSVPVVAVSGLESLAGFDVVDTADGPLIVLAKTASGEQENGVSELFLVSEIFSDAGPILTQLTDTSGVGNRDPSLAATGADIVLAWARGTDAYWSVLNAGGISEQVLGTDFVAPGAGVELSTDNTGRLLATWIVGDSEATNLAFSLLEAGAESFSPPRMLTGDLALLSRQSSILSDDGDIMSSVNYQTIADEGEPPQNNVATFLRIGGQFDLAADPSTLEVIPPNPKAGSQAIVTMDVVNLGDVDSDVIEVWFYTGEIGNANILRIQVIDEPIKPGERRTIDAPWDVEAVEDEQNIIAVVDQPQLTPDVDRSNNTATIGGLLQPDLEATTLQVSRVGGQAFSLLGTITNVSARSVGNFEVEFRLDSPEGSLLFSQEVAGLNAGVRRDVSFTWENPVLLATGARRVFMVVDPQEEVEQSSRDNLVASATASLAIVDGLLLAEVNFEVPVGSVQESLLTLVNQFPYAINDLSCFLVDDGGGAFSLVDEPIELPVMEPGTGLQLAVRFAPPAEGVFSGAIGCLAEALREPVLIPITGEGTTGFPEMEPLPVPTGPRGMLIFLLSLGLLILAASRFARA